MTKSMETPHVGDDIYRAYTVADLLGWPTVFRDDLLKDQVVLITGMAGGIGMACAALFGRLGAKVFGCGRDADKLGRQRGELAAHGIEVAVRAMSVRDPIGVVAAITLWQALVGDWRRPTPRLSGDYRTSRVTV